MSHLLAGLEHVVVGGRRGRHGVVGVDDGHDVEADEF